jgi:hypothetical protein
MDAASPARLYATLVGAFLVVFGIVGFFYSASFGSPGSVDEALGAFDCNGWANVLHVATGAIGLLVAGRAVRTYALILGTFYLALAIWGFATGEETILSLLPTGTGNDTLHLVLGLGGLLAAAGTSKPTVKARPKRKPKAAEKKPRSEPRAKRA